MGKHVTRNTSNGRYLTVFARGANAKCSFEGQHKSQSAISTSRCCMFYLAPHEYSSLIPCFGLKGSREQINVCLFDWLYGDLFDKWISYRMLGTILRIIKKPEPDPRIIASFVIASLLLTNARCFQVIKCCHFATSCRFLCICKATRSNFDLLNICD